MTEAPKTTRTTSLPRPPAHAGRQALLWALKILVSGGLMYWLLRDVDFQKLWGTAQAASFSWFLAALGIYFVTVLVSAWRWGLLLHAQHVPIPFWPLTQSFLVATFFNNFLPSNIGGDVIRIRDTAKPANSRTLAATIVLVDRGIGLLGLVFVAALGATFTAQKSDAIGPVGPGILWGLLAGAIAVSAPAVLIPQSVALVLRPLRRLHQEWFERIVNKLTTALAKFRQAPRSLAGAFVGAIIVQGLLVLFYAAVARGLHIEIPLSHLAILIPLSFIIQMAPVSVNGLGVRETTFVTYFLSLGLLREEALALSLISWAVLLVFSISGAAVYVSRRH